MCMCVCVCVCVCAYACVRASSPEVKKVGFFAKASPVYASRQSQRRDRKLRCVDSPAGGSTDYLIGRFLRHRLLQCRVVGVD